MAILAAIALAVLLAFTPIKAAQAHQKPPMPLPERIITLVKEDLASCLKVSPDEINAAPVIPVIWNDTSLGMPKPGHYYLQVLIPGYIILLEHNHTIYRYHTDTHQSFARAGKWEWHLPPIKPPEIPMPPPKPPKPILSE